jgi:hypothetical protein
MPAKRILTAAMALLLAVSFATPSGARALSASGFEYTVTAGLATVTGCTSTCPTTLNIPAALGGRSVTSIGYAAFYNNLLTTVTIPNSVTSIGIEAFNGNFLTTVTIPNSVKSIGQLAFVNNLLTTVTIGNSVKSIGDYAFKDNHITTVTIGNSVRSIGDYAFFGNSLTTVTIPNSVTAVGDNAFKENLLTTATIGSSVKSIGSGAFQSNRLTTVIIGKSVTSIGNSAFSDNLLTSLTIPSSVTGIGTYAFAANPLTSIIFLGNAPLTVDPFYQNPLTFVTRSYTATGWGDTLQGLPVVIADVRATAKVKPKVTGTSTVGKTLTAAKGTWAGYPTPTFTYQWYACTRALTAARSSVPSTCKKITGATRSTFKLTSAQRGKYVAVFVKGTSLRTTATTWLSKTTAKVK